ncbi:MAG TPA: exonuclease domain-containing protein [Gaiellaceae bacterium]|nr:exonuclease domain-containing protein [Gaiellaceae bacterium]
MIGLRRPRSWRNASYAVLDFETTGLDLKRDHVLSYGLVPVEEGRIRLSGALYGVVRPPLRVPPDSIRVHGIRPVELAGAPELRDVAGELLGALEARLLVAYASEIELAFLGRLHEDRGLSRPRHAIDVIDLAAEVATRECEDAPLALRLSDLAGRYGVPVARTHHALSDALTTAQLFLVLTTRLEQLGVHGVRALVRAGRSRRAKAFNASTLGSR